jgi:hypothetical protein
MMTFKEYLEQAEEQNVPQPILTPTNNVNPIVVSGKKWTASKKQILQYWKSLRTDIPIVIRPIPYEHRGSTYGEDGIRITGSPQFIFSVLSKLKGFLVYETKSTKLAVVYRQTQSPSKLLSGEAKNSYVFYLSTKERGKKNPRKKIIP